MNHLTIDMFLNMKVFFSDKPRRLSGLISCKIACVAETESDSEATVYYVIGAILYRTLGVILPAPMWVLLVISTLQLVRFQTTSHLLFLPMLFFFLYLSASFNTFSDKFPSLLHFIFFSLLLQTLSNSNLQFSICLLSYSVSITPPRSLCLPSYQTNVLDPPKKYISLDVSLFLLHCHVFLELRSGLRLGAGLMGPETWI